MSNTQVISVATDLRTEFIISDRERKKEIIKERTNRHITVLFRMVTIQVLVA